MIEWNDWRREKPVFKMYTLYFWGAPRWWWFRGAVHFINNQSGVVIQIKLFNCLKLFYRWICELDVRDISYLVLLLIMMFPKHCLCHKHLFRWVCSNHTQWDTVQFLLTTLSFCGTLLNTQVISIHTFFWNTNSPNDSNHTNVDKKLYFATFDYVYLFKQSLWAPTSPVPLQLVLCPALCVCDLWNHWPYCSENKHW